MIDKVTIAFKLQLNYNIIIKTCRNYYNTFTKNSVYE